jgi:hypothetical protein
MATTGILRGISPLLLSSEDPRPRDHAGNRGAGPDVIESDGSHPPKAGPCVRFVGVEGFVARRNKLDGCMTGARLAKDRAAHALTEVMIPEALDYPA